MEELAKVAEAMHSRVRYCEDRHFERLPEAPSRSGDVLKPLP